MLLSDELSKSEASLEATVTKTADTLKTLLHGDPDAWAASLVVAESSLAQCLLFPCLAYHSQTIEPIPVYLKGFSWNLMKYRVDKSLKEIHDALMAVLFCFFYYYYSLCKCNRDSRPSIHDKLQDVASIDTLMKAKTTAYSQAKGLLQSLQRKTVYAVVQR